MGLLSKLGGAVKEGLRGVAANTILDITGNNAATGKINYINAADVSKIYGTDADIKSSGVFEGNSHGLIQGSSKPRPSLISDPKLDYPQKYHLPNNKKPDGLEFQQITQNEQDLKDNGKQTYETESAKKSSYNVYKINNKDKDKIADYLLPKLPDWTYADFINERAVWQKGLSSILDEPAWFYFKIFFDFDTNHGLFGGLLNSKYLHGATNSAAKYLYSVKDIHKHAKPLDRINALYKLASILSYINTNAPWYFKSINGLNKAIYSGVEDFSQEKSIEIETLPDAIDMRLSTLMSLYKYACFDNILSKEIIPENLRKFNLTIILFQSPLRYLHTSYITQQNAEFMGINTNSIPFANKLLGFNKKSSKVNYKSMNETNSKGFADMMSMKIISLYGCEISKESLGAMIPGSISNDTPFQLGKNTIKITFTSATEHTMNEFYAMMFGSDGFYFNQYSNFQVDDFNGYVNKLANTWNEQLSRYEALSDTVGNLAQGGSILGIIDAPKTYKEAIDATEAIMNGIGESNNMLTSLGTNFALGLLGSSMNTNAPQGNIYGDYGLDSAYYKDKLEMLKNGVHERTTAPYYYDPYTGARIDLNKSRNYTAYNFKNDISAIKSFDLNNWMNTNVTDFGNKLNNGMRDLVYGKSDFVQNPYMDSSTGKLNNENNKAYEPGYTAAGEKGKTQVMIDDPNDWRNVEKPYNYEETIINNKK